MQFITILAAATAALLPTMALAQTVEPGFCPEDDASCSTCSLTCYQSCPEPLSVEECTSSCLYCRRESSACSFVRLDQSADCDACADNCVCSIGHICNPEPVPTGSGSAGPAPTGAGRKMRDLFGL
ncbi:hypothetical protein MGN70_006940 [Eutypa lata]|nr:hypothetical protein MGN70_006940 [Eutypa lata]